MLPSKFQDTDLDEVSMKIAKRSIGETPESKARGLQTLKNKLLDIKDLKACLDDEYLIRYLRVAKFDINKAFERIHKYYQMRKKYSHVFDVCTPSATGTSTEARHFHASPMRCEDNSVVIIHKRGLFNPSTMIYEEIFLLDFLIMDHLIKNSLTQISGATIIIDFAGYSYRHFFEDTPRRVRMAVESFQNAFPMRFRNIHIINAPQIFTLFYSLCYPFLTKKIKNRLHVHSNYDSLLSSLPPEILPEEYGGKIPQSDLVDLVEQVIDREDYYRDQLQYGYVKKT